MYIDDYIRALSNISNQMDSYIKKIVLDNKGQLLKVVKLRLYQKGMDADNKMLGSYSKATIIAKKNKGQVSTHITLRDTGDFYKSMFIDYNSGSIIVDATDEKTGPLEDMFGEAILGLTEDETEMFFDSVIEPELSKLIDLGDLDLGKL